MAFLKIGGVLYSMSGAHGRDVHTNFRHALQLLDTADEFGDTYTIIDVGTHHVMDDPLLIFAEDDRTMMETFPAYTDGYTALDDRVSIRLEPDSYSEQQDVVGNWHGVEFHTVRDDVRRTYREQNAKQHTDTPRPQSVEDLFTDTTGFYTPRDDMLDRFADYVEEFPDDTPEL